MATSTCPKCSNTTFEMKKVAPKGNDGYEYMFIQCDKCGCVVGVKDSFHIPTLLFRIAKKIGLDLHSNRD